MFLKFKDYAAGVPVFKKNDPVRNSALFRSGHRRLVLRQIRFGCAKSTGGRCD